MTTIDDLYSESIRETYATATSEEPVLGTLEFRHPAFEDEEGEPITAVRIVLDNVDHDLKLEAGAPVDASTTVTFTGCPIDVQLPDHTTSGVPEAQIGVDNVSRFLMPNLKLAGETNTPIEVTYREFLGSRGSIGPEFGIDGFTAKRARATPLRVTATLGFYDLLNASFPTQIYTVEEFRGLGQR